MTVDLESQLRDYTEFFMSSIDAVEIEEIHRETALVSPKQPRTRRKPVLAFVLALFVILIAAGGIALWVGTGDPDVADEPPATTQAPAPTTTTIPPEPTTTLPAPTPTVPVIPVVPSTTVAPTNVPTCPLPGGGFAVNGGIPAQPYVDLHAAVTQFALDMNLLRSAIVETDDFSSGWTQRGVAGEAFDTLVTDLHTVQAISDSILKSVGASFTQEGGYAFPDELQPVSGALSPLDEMAGASHPPSRFETHLLPTLANATTQAEALDQFDNQGICGFGAFLSDMTDRMITAAMMPGAVDLPLP